MGSFVSGWTVINIVSEHSAASNGPNVVHWLHSGSLCGIFYSNDTHVVHIIIILKSDLEQFCLRNMFVSYRIKLQCSLSPLEVWKHKCMV